MTESKVPVTKSESAPAAWPAFENLKQEIDRVFDDFGGAFWRRQFHPLADVETFVSRKMKSIPAVDVTETDKAFEITAELPGMDEKNVEVKTANGGLTIKGEKKDEREEKKKDYYLSERRYGSFERYFTLPEGVDADKIEANFKKGVLIVTLPKKPEAQKAAKKIEVKAA